MVEKKVGLVRAMSTIVAVSAERRLALQNEMRQAIVDLHADHHAKQQQDGSSEMPWTDEEVGLRLEGREAREYGHARYKLLCQAVQHAHTAKLLQGSGFQEEAAFRYRFCTTEFCDAAGYGQTDPSRSIAGGSSSGGDGSSRSSSGSGGYGGPLAGAAVISQEQVRARVCDHILYTDPEAGYSLRVRALRAEIESVYSAYGQLANSGE